MRCAKLIGRISRRGILSIIIVGLLFSFVSAADIFINNFPTDVTVQEGQPLDIPLFFYGGDLAGYPVEFFVWVESANEEAINRFYLSPDGWKQFNTYEELRPAGSIQSMLEYANITWRMIERVPKGMPSFILNICMDPNVDGALPEGIYTEGAACGSRAINIVPAPEPVCDGLYVYSGSTEVTQIEKTVKAGESAQASLTIKNSCGELIDFEATTTASWISLSKAKGALTITLNSSGLTAGQTYNGTIDIEANGVKKTVKVVFTVTEESSNCFLFFCDGVGDGGSGGGGGTGGGGGGGDTGGGGCTPSTRLLVSPWVVEFSDVKAGEKLTQNIKVENSCYDPVNYSLTVASGKDWLSYTNKTTGGFTVVVDTTGLTPKQDSNGNPLPYTGEIVISASGYKDYTLQVKVTITGKCEETNAIAEPSEIRKSVKVGQQPAEDIVKIQTNCGTLLEYTVLAVDNGAAAASPFFKTVPDEGGTGKGELKIVYPTFQEQASYKGSIKVQAMINGDPIYDPVIIPVSVLVNQQQTGVTEIIPEQRGALYTKTVYFYRQPSPKYFYFNFPAELLKKGYYILVGLDYVAGTGQTKGDADLIVRYAGELCDGKLPDERDWKLARETRNSNGENDLYYSIAKDVYETVYIISNIRAGCYYIMVWDIVGDTKLQLKLSFQPK